MNSGKITLAFMLFVTISMIHLPSPSFANTDDTATCTATIDYLITEMNAGRTYVQFHTNDNADPTNTGPGDLASPGEIRGNIVVDPDNHHLFAATANKTQNVFGHDDDQTAWENVTATADLSFTSVTHDPENSHVEFSFTIHDMNNVVGIHLHNGVPGESSSIHLADFLTDSTSLITGFANGPIEHIDGILTGTITASDLCPGLHDHDDTAPPVINAVSLNLNTNNPNLVITFDEIIDATPTSQVDLSKLFISELGGVDQVSLLGATVTATDGTAITITLTAAQRQAVVALTMPQLDLNTGAFQDVFGNAIVGIDNVAITVTGDTTVSSPLTDDIAVFRDGTWFVDTDNNGTVDIAVAFGAPTDTPLVGDFNGDGTDDITVFRDGTWFVDTDNNGTVDIAVPFGAPTDTPLVGDFNGDGTTDIAVFRDGTWFVDTDNNGTVDIAVPFGAPTDTPLVGDFNGDGTTDIAVFRDGTWFVDTDNNGTVDIAVPFGAPTDTPLVGDFDGI